MSKLRFFLPTTDRPTPPPEKPWYGVSHSLTQSLIHKPMSDPLAPFADKCVVMYSSYVSNQLFEVADCFILILFLFEVVWRRLETMLKGKHV